VTEKMIGASTGNVAEGSQRKKESIVVRYRLGIRSKSSESSVVGHHPNTKTAGAETAKRLEQGHVDENKPRQREGFLENDTIAVWSYREANSSKRRGGEKKPPSQESSRGSPIAIKGRNVR